jgi:hypothetical protein
MLLVGDGMSSVFGQQQPPAPPLPAVPGLLGSWLAGITGRPGLLESQGYG